MTYVQRIFTPCERNEATVRASGPTQARPVGWFRISGWRKRMWPR